MLEDDIENLNNLKCKPELRFKNYCSDYNQGNCLKNCGYYEKKQTWEEQNRQEQYMVSVIQ